MLKAHKNTIQRNMSALCDDLDVLSLLPKLAEASIFPDGKLELFESMQQNRNLKFLQDIKTRGPRAYEVLVKALRSTAGQEHLADVLDPNREFIPEERGSRIGFSTSAPQKETSGRQLQSDQADAPWTRTECYPMHSDPRGIVLIINNETFVDEATLPTREGTNQDCERVENLFGDKLGFLVVKKQNLTLEQMKEVYHKYQNEDHSKYNCFVSVILSHGLHDGICGVDYDKDRHEVLSIEQVVSGMDSCESLAGKPKVFFTQACRGEKVHRPKMIQTDARRSNSIIEKNMEKLTLGDAQNVEGNSEDPPTVDQRTHVGSDVLIAYPSIKGYAAAREPNDGTWYIKNLCEVLEKNADKEHLIDMLTRVNKLVGEERGMTPDGSTVTQTSEYTSTLKQKLYFPPTPATRVHQATN